MKRFVSYTAAAVIMLVLAGFFAATISLQPKTNTGSQRKAGQVSAAASIAPISPLPSVEPIVTTPAPTATPLITEEPFVSVGSIKVSEMTPLPLTPQPDLPPTPYLVDEVVTDETNTFGITVPKGWYAFFPSSILEGEVTIANFDLGALEGRPEGGISIHFGVGTLNDGQTFEQWLAERTAEEMAPLYGPPPRVLTALQPVSVAGYSGVSNRWCGRTSSCIRLFRLGYANRLCL